MSVSIFFATTGAIVTLRGMKRYPVQRSDKENYMKSALFVLFALIPGWGCSPASAPDVAQQSLVADSQSVASNEAATEIPYCTNAALCRPVGGTCCNNKFRDRSCRGFYRCCRLSGGSCSNGNQNIFDTCCSHLCNHATNLCR
jgi:hypothetical protein